MKEFNVFKVYPGGNTTLLVEDNELTAHERAVAAKELLTSFEAEQVGFIDFSLKILHMMGGELCINATRSFVHILAKNILEKTDAYSETVYTANQEIKVRAWKEKGKVYTAIALPAKHEFFIKNGYTCVKLEGITHVLVPAQLQSKKEYIEEAQRLILELAIEDLAIGLCFYFFQEGKWQLIPIVYVPATETIMYETACGSGSLALAFYLHKEGKGKNFEILQPSNIAFFVTIPCEETIVLKGESQIISEGKFTLQSV